MSEPEEQCPPLETFEAVLGYRFQDPSLLETALQHSSFANEAAGRTSNERLEFLGDSVLGLAVAQQLYEVHPSWPEGDLSRAYHSLVDQRALAGLGRRLGIGDHLRLGSTELQSKGREKASILEDAMEAVIGAVYLDGGLAPVVEFIRRVYSASLAADAAPVERDPKSRLNEWVHMQNGVFPIYECIDDTGVDGDESRFTSRVLIEDECWGEGRGRSKRSAERSAAVRALVRVDEQSSAAGSPVRGGEEA
jgi:ribonuclease-3